MFVKSQLGLRIVGIVKLGSAVILGIAGIGIFHFVGGNIAEDLKDLAALVRIDPGNHYINSILSWVVGRDQSELKAIGAGTFFYAVLYTVEGVGLVLYRKWAEYLTVIATGFFLPLEIYEVYEKINFVRVTVLSINLIIVLYLVYLLKKQNQELKLNSSQL